MLLTRLFNTIYALNDKFLAQNHILGFMFFIDFETFWHTCKDLCTGTTGKWAASCTKNYSIITVLS